LARVIRLAALWGAHHSLVKCMDCNVCMDGRSHVTGMRRTRSQDCSPSVDFAKLEIC
jgi:hypothetical protein